MEFPSNSHKVTEGRAARGSSGEKERVPLEKAVTGEVIQKKKSLGKRFKEVFLGADSKGAANYIVAEVLLPAFRNMVVDATEKGIRRFVYGDTTGGRYRSQQRGRTSYNSPVSRGLSSMMNPRSVMLPDQPPRHSARDGGDIVLSSNEDAAIILDRLNEIVDQYGVASVADLHDLAGLPTTYIDNKWGWVDLKYSKVRQTREGFILDLPPIEPID